LLQLLKDVLRPQRETTGFVFSRPLVAIQSDDWGRVGVRDRDGYERLRAKGINLGENPYDLYSFETATDLSALAEMLLRHRDSVGRPPSIAMSFCTANLDFGKMRARGFKHIELMPLSQGLPGSWWRPGLMEAYRAGMNDGAFYPTLHGLTHFCPVAVESALEKGGERAEMLRTFWECETPYIYWRMPWVGYEFWNPEQPRAGFLAAELQEVQIRKAKECFSAFFGVAPVAACAPGYYADRNTREGWARSGIRVVQNGTDNGLRAPFLDTSELLHVHRTLDLEPHHQDLPVEKFLEIAGNYFARGLPVVISTHAINFHSTLKDFRTPTLTALDTLLAALETKYPELLYVHDQDLYAIVTEGVFQSHNEHVKVSAKRDWKAHAAHQGAS
jgi:hypothetical protein